MSAPVIACFGEVLLRLGAPDRELLLQSPRLTAHFGGAEANVAVGLARLGGSARLIGALPHGAIGDAALGFLRGHGVDCAAVSRAPGRMGLYFYESGGAARAANVTYDREHSAFLNACDGLLDWAELLNGAAHLHLSGITPALSRSAHEQSLRACDVAVAMGLTISFDCNIRAKLWPEGLASAGIALAPFATAADILFASARDIALLSGAPEQDLDHDAAADLAFSAFPKLRLLATTHRHNDKLEAIVHGHDSRAMSDAVSVVHAVDRIGGGDAFATGVLCSYFRGERLDVVAATGLALAVLKHDQPGDASLATPAMLRDYLNGTRLSR